LHKNTLYITFDGLSDPLGQSQILPYLCDIAANGFHIHILSCEKKERLEAEKPAILALIKTLPITWDYIFYDEDGSFLSRLGYIRRIKALAARIHLEKKIALVHCRSYLASLIGLSLKLKYNIPFIFDMRGFWADERIDGGIWKKYKPLDYFFYRYFKKKEKQFILESDAIVSLTEAAVKELGNFYPPELLAKKTTVIPCCTDTHLFNKETLETVPELPLITPEDHLLIYTGSIGTWYYTREMIDCVYAWRRLIPSVKLLILTKDEAEVNRLLKTFHLDQRSYVIVESSSHKEVAGYLSRAKAAIFFIKPSYSKIASSPTKMAECWSMDLPIITNAGIGDNDLYFNTHHGGILVNDFNESCYVECCRQYLALSGTPGHYRDIALRHFDTRMAREKYTAIYNSLIG